jgi:hypothetical protein
MGLTALTATRPWRNRHLQGISPKANPAKTSPIFNPAFCSSATLPVNFTATKKVLSVGVAILPAEGSYRSIPSAQAASVTRYPVRPQLRELAVKSAGPQQLQAVLRTPGGTAVIVWHFENGAARKNLVKARFFVTPAATMKLDAGTHPFLLSCDRTKEVI